MQFRRNMYSGALRDVMVRARGQHGMDHLPRADLSPFPEKSCRRAASFISLSGRRIDFGAHYPIGTAFVATARFRPSCPGALSISAQENFQLNAVPTEHVFGALSCAS